MSMSNDLGRWMGAVSDIKKAEEYNKRPPLFKKLFASGSVEEEAMQIFMAKKKADDMRYQLKQIISLTRKDCKKLFAWDELLRTEGQIRKQRQKMIYDQQERRKEILNAIGILFLVCCIGGVIALFLGMMIDIYGHPRTW